MTWNVTQIGDLSGRTAVVTGPSAGGLGHYTALELARAGAHVVLAGRNPERVEETVTAIRTEVPGAELSTVALDLADLAQVRRAGAELSALPRLDLLVNNAGVMMPGTGRTVDGFGIQMGTNHFGPFLLTHLLLPLLAASGTASRPARVVSVSSALHRSAPSVPLGDPLTTPATGSVREYGQSKLANLLFTYELARRLDLAGAAVTALAAHPGFAGTHLGVNGRFGGVTGLWSRLVDSSIGLIGQPAPHGAWPTLMAATADLPSGTFVGPSKMREMRGAPMVVGASALALNPENQQRLWALSETTVGHSSAF